VALVLDSVDVGVGASGVEARLIELVGLGQAVSSTKVAAVIFGAYVPPTELLAEKLKLTVALATSPNRLMAVIETF